MVDKIDILIKSMFDATGFSQASKAVNNATAKLQSANQILSDVSGFNSQRKALDRSNKVWKDSGLAVRKSGAFYDRTSKDFVSVEKASERLGASMKKIDKQMTKSAAGPTAPVDRVGQAVNELNANKKLMDSQVKNNTIMKQAGIDVGRTGKLYEAGTKTKVDFADASARVAAATKKANAPGETLAKPTAPVNQVTEAMQQVKARQQLIDTQMLNTKIMDKAGLAINEEGKFFNKSTGDIVKTAEATKQVTKATKQVNTQMKGLKEPPFQGWALSVMFMGMQIQRIFQTILTSSVASFVEIISKSADATSAITVLGAQFTGLKFAVGEAINSFVAAHPEIGELIQKIDDWVQQNQTLTASLVIWGMVVGLVLFMIGQLALGLVGFVFMIKKAGFFVLTLSGNLTTLITKLAAGELSFAAMGASVSSFLNILGWVALVIAILWVLWKTNFGNMQGFVVNTFAIIVDLFKRVFKRIIKIFGGLIDIIFGIMEGDWTKVWNGFIEVIKQTVGLVSDILIGLGAIVFNIVAWIYNMIMDLITNVIVNGIMSLLNTIFMLINKLPGNLVPQEWIDGLNSAQEAVEGFNDSIEIQYMTLDDVKAGNSFMDDVLDMGFDSMKITNADTVPATTDDYLKDLDLFTEGEDFLSGLFDKAYTEASVPPFKAEDDYMKQAMINYTNDTTYNISGIMSEDEITGIVRQASQEEIEKNITELEAYGNLTGVITRGT